MENDLYQSEPNLLAETYRNKSNLQMPRRIERHFDFLEISDGGFFLLGTSNLSGRIWSGSIWIFEEYSSVPVIENCVAGIEFESSVASGLWLMNDKKIVIGCDSGILHFLTLNTQIGNKEKNYFSVDGILTEHDDSIIALDYMKIKQKIISGGMDMNIIVWDEETLSNEKSYCPAHGHMVTSVSAQVQHNDTFVSASLDGTSLIWDTRLEKPANLLLENKCGYTASTWVDENSVALGANDGSVSLVDLRMKQELDQNICAQRPIFKLKFKPDLELLSVCADDPIVRVFSTKEKRLNNIYECNQHKDFVRGLAWDFSSDVLYSCGWDSKIYLHNITCSKPESNLTDSKDSNSKQIEESC